MSEFQSSLGIATISSPAVIGDDALMPSHRDSPTVRRRRLAANLKRLREEKGLTQEDVARELDRKGQWSEAKVRYIEAGKSKRINPRDVSDLLDLYEVTNERQRQQLVSWAKEGAQRGWWHAFKDQLSEAYTTYVGLEAGASGVRNWEQGTVAGLLQTEEYARAIIASGASELSPELIDDRVQVRMKRQELLTQDDPLRLWVVMDEAALRRRVGGPEVMRDQMRHLLEMAKLPRVTLQVITFDAGAHAGGRGPFHILEFPDPDDIDTVYVDNVAGELFVEDLDQVRRFDMAFQKLVAIAASPSDTIRMITEVANQS